LQQVIAVENRVNSVKAQTGKLCVIPSQAPQGEGVTTRAQARRAKRPEAPGPLPRGDEIVCPAWRHAAARKGGWSVAISSEQTRVITRKAESFLRAAFVPQPPKPTRQYSISTSNDRVRDGPVFEVSRKLPKPDGIVLGVAQTQVASTANPAAKAPGLVAMVKVQP